MRRLPADPMKSLRSVTLVLTSGCNLSCSYCYQNAKSGRRMSWETLRRAVDTLLGSSEMQLGIVFYGGEPLVRFDLVRRAVDYVAAARRPDQEIEYAILTNGTLIGEAEADFLARHDFRVQLSLDGVPAVQALRGEGTFEILDALLDRLTRDHADWFHRRVVATATVLPSTVPHLSESVGYLLGKGLGGIRFSPAATDTSSWRPERIHQLDEQFERIFRMSLRLYRRTGRVPVECLRKPRGPRETVGANAMCNVERARELTVDVDGEVYGCTQFAESFQEFPGDFLESRLARMRLGEISRRELPERVAAFPEAVAEADIFHHRDRKYSTYRECRTCEFLDRCFVCPVSIGQIPGNTDPHRIPDFLCAFSLVSNRYRERMAAQPGWLDWILEPARARRSGRQGG